VSSPEREHLHDLLADLAAGEPDARARESEVRERLAGHEDLDLASFERAAAAIQLASLPSVDEELPPALRERLLEAADAYERGQRASAVPQAPAPARPGPALPLVPVWMGWLVAAAASLALFVQLSRSSGSDNGGGGAALDLDRVLASSDALRVAWSTTEDPDVQGVTGEVVWSNALQQGFMRFEGLQRNDPTVGQFQLWIFDAERPEETPVDGGVFDATGESLVVPIDAKLEVGEPTLFAVTWEKPGGVVVSKRERILLVAAN